jgi:hypothetical protein
MVMAMRRFQQIQHGAAGRAAHLKWMSASFYFPLETMGPADIRMGAADALNERYVHPNLTFTYVNDEICTVHPFKVR